MTKIGCAFCPQEFESDEALLAHAGKEHGDKLRRRPDNTARQTVLVNFILDKSGSMGEVVSDTLGGFNAYLEELGKETAVDYLFSLTLFDTWFEDRYIGVPLGSVQQLNRENYHPEGWTALYDAIGTTVRKVDKEGLKYDKVVTVIMTDGHENSSREFTLRHIQDVIAAKEN